MQFRYLLANLRKIYIHDVNVDASQADRALNWTARITKNIPSISGLPMLGTDLLAHINPKEERPEKKENFSRS